MNKHPCSSSTWIYRRKPPTCSIHHIITDGWGAQRGKKNGLYWGHEESLSPSHRCPPPPLLYTSLSPVYELCTQNPAHAVRGHCYSTMGLQRNCTKAHRPEPCPRGCEGGGINEGRATFRARFWGVTRQMQWRGTCRKKERKVSRDGGK